MKSRLHISAMLVLFVLLLAGCADAATGTQQVAAPTVPPIDLTVNAQIAATQTAEVGLPQSPAQEEVLYKKSTTATTVDALDKNGNGDKDKDVHFTCVIVNFLKDDSGNTAGANVGVPGASSDAVVEIAFPSVTDLSQLNEGDSVEVWGRDEGVFSGKNAFGGT
ncbi:MAG: hypothetical protein ACJ788_22970, partial [Ktedonobacteraceae bacterium]